MTPVSGTGLGRVGGAVLGVSLPEPEHPTARLSPSVAYGEAMTDVVAPPTPEPPAHGTRNRLVAVVVTLAVLLGLALVVRAWVRRGGARRVITELAEEGAVKLADRIVDEVLPAA